MRNIVDVYGQIEYAGRARQLVVSVPVNTPRGADFNEIRIPLSAKFAPDGFAVFPFVETGLPLDETHLFVVSAPDVDEFDEDTQPLQVTVAIYNLSEKRGRVRATHNVDLEIDFASTGETQLWHYAEHPIEAAEEGQQYLTTRR